MKKIFFLFAITSLALFFASCDDDDCNCKTEGSLLSVESATSYSPKEMSTAIANSAYVQNFLGSNRLFLYAVEGLCQSTATSNRFHLDTLFAKKEGAFLLTYKRSWHIESYVFTYLSSSSHGEPIVLSGRVSFPNSDNGAAHTVNSLSLCAHEMTDAAGVPSRSVQPTILRTLFNSAVIEPDYQGYGVSMGSHYPGFSTDVLGQQMTDCVKAALEVMQQHGVSLAKDGYSTAWGNSVGAAAILGMARYYDERLSADEKASINLKSVNISNGILMPEQMMQYFDQHPLYNASLASYVLPFVNALPESKLGGYDLEDLAPKWMNDKIINIDGESCSFFYALSHDMDYRSQWPTNHIAALFKNHLNEEMYNDKGRLDYSNAKTIMLMNLLHFLGDWGGWMPSSDIYITHSRLDDRMPFDQAEAFASSKTACKNIHFKNVGLPKSNLISISSHRNLCANALLNSLKYETPAKAYKNSD